MTVRAHHGPQSWYFLFSHRAQGKWESRFYALSKALIAFRFCTKIGPTEAHVLPCAPARNNVSIQSYRGAEVRLPEALRASVSRTTIFIMPTLASICSTGDRLQMVKISKRSVEKVKKLWALEDLYIRPQWRTRPKTCAGHFHWRARNWCQKLAPNQSFIVRHCVKFSVPWVSSNSPWKGFPHNFHALIWATCSWRIFAQMTERCSWALLITLQ